MTFLHLKMILQLSVNQLRIKTSK